MDQLIKRKQLTCLGLNSGTSADSLDLALMRIRRTNKRVAVKYLCGTERRFDPDMKSLIHASADAEKLAPEDTIELDGLLGMFFGRAARSYITQLERRGVKVDMVASHGQTIRHCPEKVKRLGRWVHGTMQLGSIERIAAGTGRITVGDFRQAEVAVGGEGAPVTVGAMHRLFARPTESRLIVNIGGMANYFYLPSKESGLKTAAADCGPGNSLCDLLCARLFKLDYDTGGRLAASGSVYQDLLADLTTDDFFVGRTKSTGRERFGPAMVDRIIAFGKRYRVSAVDMLRTAAELTVIGIVRSLRPLLRRDKSLEKLYLTGGGRRNIFFVRQLVQSLPRLQIRSADELGVDADCIEAAAYAVMGEACIRAESLPTTAHRRAMQPVLGRIAQPPHVTHGRR
ncbi:MAG: anhydro-N-acetylmuramic acid kinase [candidate division Zixibacteria bacterium]|nr:anhydro-N-acetylmuramic acid kinase [candidate division Zixibacteria bacterium]